jgi:hypothetical protein
MSKYRTAQGRVVDMSALSTRNEKTRAVGNMNVNARGDTLDSNNKVITDNTKRVNRTYNKTVTKRPTTQPTPAVDTAPVASPIEADELTPDEKMFEEEDDEEIKK